MPIELTSNEIEAANRAEATELLIRAGFRVYRPEADCHGEDLILRTPTEELLPVQLKGRWTVDQKYFGRSLWMLFPGEPYSPSGRRWFLVLHDELYKWVEQNHGHTPVWKRDKRWSAACVSEALCQFLDPITAIPKGHAKTRATSAGGK
jgi:hypothetical protein